MNVKPIHYHGDSFKALSRFPEKKKEKFALSLSYLQFGMDPVLKTKAMKGLGHGVLELTQNGQPAYRCVYVVADDAIHVLHAFVKTSDATDSKHEKTIKERYKQI
ncbi:type II toxin-antitoxin system RelE/ParE family toxin [Aeromonas veronii]